MKNDPPNKKFNLQTLLLATENTPAHLTKHPENKSLFFCVVVSSRNKSGLIILGVWLTRWKCVPLWPAPLRRSAARVATEHAAVAAAAIAARQGRPRVSNSVVVCGVWCVVCGVWCVVVVVVVVVVVLGHDPFDVVHVRIRRGVVSDMMCCVSGYSLFYARARRAPTVIPGVLGKGCKSQDTRFLWSFPFVRSWLVFFEIRPCLFVYHDILSSELLHLSLFHFHRPCPPLRALFLLPSIFYRAWLCPSMLLCVFFFLPWAGGWVLRRVSCLMSCVVSVG